MRREDKNATRNRVECNFPLIFPPPITSLQLKSPAIKQPPEGHQTNSVYECRNDFELLRAVLSSLWQRLSVQYPLPNVMTLKHQQLQLRVNIPADRSTIISYPAPPRLLPPILDRLLPRATN